MQCHDTTYNDSLQNGLIFYTQHYNTQWRVIILCIAFFIVIPSVILRSVVVETVATFQTAHQNITLSWRPWCNGWTLRGVGWTPARCQCRPRSGRPGPSPASRGQCPGWPNSEKWRQVKGGHVLRMCQRKIGKVFILRLTHFIITVSFQRLNCNGSDEHPQLAWINPH